MEMNEKEAVREPEGPKEELWDDLPHDSQHDELWEADGTELAVRQLMEQLKESDEKRTALQKKQLFFTRILRFPIWFWQRLSSYLWPVCFPG